MIAVTADEFNICHREMGALKFQGLSAIFILGF
jgi:hypothetical protein